MNTNVDEQEDSQERSATQRPEQSPTPKPSALKKWAIRLVVYPALLYICIVGILAFNETYLVYPGSTYPKGNWTPTNFEFEEVELLTTDGKQIIGWFLPHPPNTESDSPNVDAVLICHGNAENVAQSSEHTGDKFRHALKADVFVFDYRGYGKNAGTPDEQGVKFDAEAAMKFICVQTNKKPEEIIVVGHSLGGGPAVHLAKKFDCKALILQRTFSSLPDVAANQYPWIPIHFIMRNRFESFKTVRKYRGPIFQSHGDADVLIPIKFAKKLFDNAPTDNKQFFEVPGMTHWDPLPPNYWDEVAQFVRAIKMEEIETGEPANDQSQPSQSEE